MQDTSFANDVSGEDGSNERMFVLEEGLVCYPILHVSFETLL